MTSLLCRKNCLIFLLLIALLISLGYLVRSSNNPGSTCKAPNPTDTHAPASEILCGLVQTEEFAGHSFDRDLFKYESDLDSDGHWTRSEILMRDSTVEVHSAWRNGRSYIDIGNWFSPLDGRSYTYSSEIEVDHLVSLKEAWDSGAWRWSTEKLRLYANDLEYPTLTVMSIHSNRSKGEKDFAEYKIDYAKCWFAQMWVLVKFRWKLTVDPTEKNALSVILNGECGKTRLKIS